MKSDCVSRHIAARCPPGSAGNTKAICRGLKNSLSWRGVEYSGLGIISRLTLCRGPIEGSTKHVALDRTGAVEVIQLASFGPKCHLSVV